VLAGKQQCQGEEEGPLIHSSKGKKKRKYTRKGDGRKKKKRILQREKRVEGLHYYRPSKGKGRRR